MCDEFFYRVARGDTRMVAAMLAKHPEWCIQTWQNRTRQVNCKWLNKTALWIAMQQNQAAMVELLLACKADDATKVTDDFETGLHVASQFNNLDMMQTMLPSTVSSLFNGVDGVVNVQMPGLEARNREGQTALQLAVRHNSIEAVQLLLASKADILACTRGTVLHLAQTASMTSLLLHNLTSKALESVINQEAVMDVEIQIRPNMGTNTKTHKTLRLNMTPLMMAASRQDADSCRLLLDANAQGMLSCGKSYAAYTALDFCMAATHQVLTSHMLPGCPGNRTKDKCYTLRLAATRQHGECLTIMLEHKADPNQLHDEDEPNRWFTALAAAACFGTECVELLLASKADVDVGCVDDNMELAVSALMFAVRSKKPEVVRLLINAKANVNLGDVGVYGDDNDNDDDDDDDNDVGGDGGDDAQRHPIFPLREAIRVSGLESFRLIGSKANEAQRHDARKWLPSSFDDDDDWMYTEKEKRDMQAMLAMLDEFDQAAQALQGAQTKLNA